MRLKTRNSCQLWRLAYLRWWAVYEKAYSENLDAAFEKAQSAEKDIEAAQEKVDKLAEALDVTEQKIATEAEQSDKAAAGFSQLSKSDWEQQDILFTSAVENYIIPQIEGKNVTNFKCEKVYGFDRQNYNYFVVTYEEDGVPVTRYFNYDRVDKVANADRYNSLRSS